MIELDLEELRSWFGFGVAGNFAGHLDQAGEAVDFATVAAKEGAPKGIFPWYAPGYDSFLGEFPLSHDALMVPSTTEFDGPLNLQIEPEVGLACEVVWEGDTVVTLRPFALGAFNDCSIRRPNAPKISHKKNWGPASKGVAHEFFEISDLTPDGPTATLRLLCHLRTADGVHHEYGVDLLDVLRPLTQGPAGLLGLDAGVLSQGAPADLVLFDAGAPVVVDAATLRSKSKNSPFDGRRLQGKVLLTVVGGRIVHDAR